MTPYGCKDEEVGHYTCCRALQSINIDNILTDEIWQNVPKSPRFVDMVSGAPGIWDTQMAAQWDNDNLYVKFWVEEPDVRATFTERDSRVYLENDVEVFIGGEDCYYEFQINALGTVCEVFYIWQDALERFDQNEFDLHSRNIDVLGGFQDFRYEKHPRGKRWAFMDWDFPGLQTVVKVDGTLNDSSDVDKGWAAGLIFPWRGMTHLAAGRSLPPTDGDTWRMDFSRFEALQSCGETVDPSPGWSFNKHGVYDSHIPECFTYVHFQNQT